MSSDKCVALRREVAAAFDDAEEQLKRFERLGQETFSPAINQLRYAGRHVIDADAASSEAECEDHLRKALGHCQRAAFDVRETTISLLLGEIVEFQRMSFRLVDIMTAVPDYMAQIAKVHTAQQALISAGSLRDSGANGQALLEKAVLDLIDFKFTVLAKMPVIKRLDEEYRVKEQRDTRRFIIGFVLALIGLLLSLLTILA